jgi:hypothetical protein
MSRMKKLSSLSMAIILLMSSMTAIGQEKKSADEAKTSAIPTNGQTSNLDQRKGEKSDRVGNDESVRQHGALGVLLRKSGDGVTVVGVIPGSPAARAGVRWGDEIRKLGDRSIRSTQEFTEVIRDSKPGAQVNLQLFRKGQSQDTKATLGTQVSTFGPAYQTPSDVSSLNEPDVVATPNPQQSTITKSQIQVLNQQVHLLNQQIDLLHQQLDRLSAPPTAVRTTPQIINSNDGGDGDDWWSRNQRGETSGDPSLFQ